MRRNWCLQRYRRCFNRDKSRMLHYLRGYTSDGSIDRRYSLCPPGESRQPWRGDLRNSSGLRSRPRRRGLRWKEDSRRLAQQRSGDGDDGYSALWAGSAGLPLLEARQQGILPAVHLRRRRCAHDADAVRRDYRSLLALSGCRRGADHHGGERPPAALTSPCPQFQAGAPCGHSAWRHDGAK